MFCLSMSQRRNCLSKRTKIYCNEVNRRAIQFNKVFNANVETYETFPNEIQSIKNYEIFNLRIQRKSIQKELRIFS